MARTTSTSSSPGGRAARRSSSTGSAGRGGAAGSRRTDGATSLPVVPSPADADASPTVGMDGLTGTERREAGISDWGMLLSSTPSAAGLSASTSDEHLNATTTAAGPPVSELVRRRATHQAAFEATLKEVFLTHQVQLTEPIAKASRETIVYGGRYHGEEVAIKIFVPAIDDPTDALSAFGSFKVECEKTMILSRRSKYVLPVIEYGDAELPEHLEPELREFFPLQILPFMISARAPFGSLDLVMKAHSRLPGFDRISLLDAVITATAGIKEAHDHLITHRDIKPQNILIFAPGQGKIADFGIARWRSRRKSADAVLLTPKYACPEQAFFALTDQHDTILDLRGDVYSWAIVVYEVVTGIHPFAWSIRGLKDPLTSQRTLLKAIAANDRRGFQPTGDITFDSLMNGCTTDLKHRLRDISVANRVLQEFVARAKAQR